MKRTLFSLGVALAVVVAVFSVPSAKAMDSEPPVSGVRSWFSTTFIAATPFTTQPTQTATISTTSPLLRSGFDVSEVANWAMVDVFATATVNGSAWITITPEFSADAVNWAPAVQVLENVSGTTSIGRVINLTASETKYIRVPVYGTYMRIKLQNTGTTTPTVRAVFRNGQ